MGAQQGNSNTSAPAWWSAALIVLLLHIPAPTSFAEDAPESSKHFAESVVPILKQHCYECHSHEANTAEGGLVLDSRRGWSIGGDSGPAIVPGEPVNSLLLTAVNYANTDLQMPPDGKLSRRDIDGLASITEQKRTLVAQLDDPSHGPGDYEESDPSLAAQLTGLIESCRHQNTVNGAVIDLLSRYNERSLQILLGQSPTETVYGPAGHERSGPSSRYSASV